MVSTLYVCENYETTKPSDDEVEAIRKLWSAFCYPEPVSAFYFLDTLVSIKLPGTGVSLRIPRSLVNLCTVWLNAIGLVLRSVIFIFCI
jgi:hypothetical protein